MFFELLFLDLILSEQLSVMSIQIDIKIYKYTNTNTQINIYICMCVYTDMKYTLRYIQINKKIKIKIKGKQKKSSICIIIYFFYCLIVFSIYFLSYNHQKLRGLHYLYLLENELQFFVFYLKNKNYIIIKKKK